MALRGDRRIVLESPVAPTEEDFNDFGEQVNQRWEEHVVFARREDGSGRESDVADVAVAAQTVRWVVQKFGIEGVSPSWRLRDDGGNLYNIVAVSEAPQPIYPPRRYLIIHSVLHTGR